MQLAESPAGSLQRARADGSPQLDSKTLRDLVADQHLRWPRRLAAGRVLVERGACDEWAMDAYALMSCDAIPEIRTLAVLGHALDRSTCGLDMIVEILAAEASRATPDAAVALTALHAIDGYSMLLWKDVSIDLRAVLNEWLGHPSSPLQAKAREMVALLDPWGARCR